MFVRARVDGMGLDGDVFLKNKPLDVTLTDRKKSIYVNLMIFWNRTIVLVLKEYGSRLTI